MRVLSIIGCGLLAICFAAPAFAKSGVHANGTCYVKSSSSSLVAGHCSDGAVHCASDNTCTIDGYSSPGSVQDGKWLEMLKENKIEGVTPGGNTATGYQALKSLQQDTDAYH